MSQQNKSARFEGVAHAAALLLQQEHLCDAALWRKFVSVFREKPDGANGGWRGEYFGKMMRGAVTVYEYTRDAALYAVLTDAIRDLLTVADGDGRVSSYTREAEFTFWDLWGRKYVLLGCEYYLQICKDEVLKKEIIAFCAGCADAILAHVGEGKKDITDTSLYWDGINSSSLLEPMVFLYRLTDDERYLDFARYIVERGGAASVNVFRLAYEGKLYPYEYGVPKAYELTSCFEGLLAYYEVTGISWCKTAVLNYARGVLDSEISIVGGCGMTHELFDHTRTRQTESGDGVKQETCVTVTLMKFFSRLLTLTGDSAYADVIERSFYNAYLGALNTDRAISQNCRTAEVTATVLPFDSYSPLTADSRGRAVGGFQSFPDKSYYGCCACIGAVGVGVFLKQAVTVTAGTATVNFYERGTVSFRMGDVPITLRIDTDYPRSGNIKLHLRAERPVAFTLRLRTPAWADGKGGYALHERLWQDDTVTLSFDTPVVPHFPEHRDEDTVYIDTSRCTENYFAVLPKRVYHEKAAEHYVAVTRGPLTLAADSRTGKDASSVFPIPKDGVPCESEIAAGIPCLVKLRFDTPTGEHFYLIDYASAGKDWETKVAAWLKTE